jgi:hypothetical protein
MPIRLENRARYPACWPLLSRIIRLGRARQQCEWCQALNRHPHPVTGSIVVLTVAHVDDRSPEACGFGNLAALCQRCHLGHDRPHHLAVQRENRSGMADLFSAN